jgi:N-methylhydantoinase B/oxoprolinase/acetone carboxylase alpha subunit
MHPWGESSSANVRKFVDAKGSDDCWEVKALNPQELARETLSSLMDLALLNQEVVQEQQDAQHLSAVRITISKSFSTLDFDFDGEDSE